MTSTADKTLFDSAVEKFFSEINEITVELKEDQCDKEEVNSYPQLLSLPPPPPPPPPRQNCEDDGTTGFSDDKKLDEEPTTNWQMLFDTSEGYPYYWNKESKESVWQPPTEFIKYTEEYAAYKSYHATIGSVENSSDVTNLEAQPSKETRHSAVEYLTEYIGYSSSSCSSDSQSDSTDSDQASNKSHETETSNKRKRKLRSQSTQKHSKEQKLDPSLVDLQQADDNIEASDNQLPTPIITTSCSTSSAAESFPLVDYGNEDQDSSCDEHFDDDNHSPVTFIGPLMPDKATEDSETNNVIDESSTKTTKQDSPNETVKQSLFDRSHILLEKCRFFKASESSLAWQQIALIQLMTREEDWKLGELSTEYFDSHLYQMEKKMADYEESKLTLGWTCHWSSEQKQYYYESQITGDTQWEFPFDSIYPAPESVESCKTSNSAFDLMTDSKAEEGEILESTVESTVFQKVNDKALNSSEKSKPKKLKKVKSKKKKSKKSRRSHSKISSDSNTEV